MIVSPRSVLPSPFTSVTAADLVSWSAEVCAIGVETDELLDGTVGPAGFRPDALAVLVITPASTSAWVIV